MTPEELLKCFGQFTRADWNKMEELRGLAFELTPEEKAEQEKRIKANRIAYLTDKLALYGIKFVESDDYSKLYHAYIFDMPDLKEFWGKQEKLQEKYEELIKNNNNLDGLYNTVAQLEG